eukprot:TRINITY_DN1971_c0_g2_i2.p1 TRINITY_DN1971_c0_g2~~TRINITY_DN1971_c0_g2_i2.p1  ORF type:complete len:133 (-),score=39.39 TRINITY_DN1971_c0_g2_i2:300-698(-)
MAAAPQSTLQSAQTRIDRTKTCPFLVRVFFQVGSNHSEDQYHKELPTSEMQIHTWKDATLRELADLIKNVVPEARRYDAKLRFKLVYPDKSGRYVMKDLGMVTKGQRSRDDLLTLAQLKFDIGDFLDVAVLF